MTLEQTLVDELRAVAAVQAPPPPAVSDLARIAEHERAHSRRIKVAGAAVVAAAVVAAIVVGTQVGRPNATPSPVHPSPSYYAPGVPYLQNQTLYVDHRPQPGEWFTVESYGDYTIALSVDQTATILRDGEPFRQVDGLVQVVALSFDGTKAAWITSDPQGGSAVVVVQDLPTDRELGRLSVAGFDSAAGFSLTVRNDGTAFYDANGKQARWKPGAGDPVPVDQMPSESPAHPDGFAGIDAPVRLSPDHLWGAWVTDPDGREVADIEGRALGVTVQRPGDPTSRFTMPLPAGLDLAPLVSWLTPTELTFAGPENMRCDIVRRECRALGTS